MNKTELRKLMLEKRADCDSLMRDLISAKICEKFYEFFYFYKRFLLYSPIRAEVDVNPLIERLTSEGKEVYLPSVCGEGLDFRLFESFDRLSVKSFGICESEGCRLSGGFDVAVVPGIAFDANLYRLGYGKGFYDRFFALGYPCIRVGLAYDFQIVETVYPEGHDEPVDIIVTEKQIIRRH